MDDFWEDCENSGSAGRCSIHVPHSPSGKFLTYIWLRVHPFHAVNLCLCLSLRQVRLAAGWAQLFWNIQQQSDTRPDQDVNARFLGVEDRPRTDNEGGAGGGGGAGAGFEPQTPKMNLVMTFCWCDFFFSPSCRLTMRSADL